MTNQDIYRLLDQKAPFALAEEWDNVGLLIGNPADEVSRVLVALDATPDAVQAAKAMGADLIITHHPVIFEPLKTLDSHSIPYMLAAAGIAVISAHTNTDKACGGVNDVLAARLGLTDLRVTEDGFCRIGTLARPTEADTFAKMVADTLDTAVRTNGGDTIRTVGVCGGSGGDFIAPLAQEIDAFVTGEVRHHQWLEANALGVTVLEAGHHATEVLIVDTLCTWLKEAFPTLAVTAYHAAAPYETVR
jgi:dinuclear metal center YbgI/SA1388 family protein